MSRYIAPCPYCGHERTGYMVHYVGDRMACSRITCHECGVTGPYGVDLDEAAERWNAMPRREEADGPDH